jgi:hypothetical protein
MKNHAIGMLLAMGAALVGGTALEAQSNELSAKVPFAFQLAGKDFAAGRYVVREHGYLMLPSVQNVATGQHVFVSGADHVLSPVGPPRLVFHCYAGSTCFLAEIRMPSGPGTQVAMSRAEKEIVKSERPREMATISVDLRHAD